MSKIKVVWICHFSNENVRNKLTLKGYCFENFVRKIFKKKQKTLLDFAPWVNNLIKEFEKIDDVDLHIIAPHKGMVKQTEEFEHNGIKYHFFSSEREFPFNVIENHQNKKIDANFSRNRKIIKKFLDKINPDIVNLIGAENPYYASSVLDIENYPVYLSCQTIYSNPDRERLQGGGVSHLNWSVEQEIFKKVLYYGTYNKTYYNLIKQYQPKANIFPMLFPITKVRVDKVFDKEFDFVWFASNISIKKGIYNAFNALVIVKQKYPNVKLVVIGQSTKEYRETLVQETRSLGIEENVIFQEPFEKHQDLFNFVTKARIALLPVKLDVISSTIIESMTLGIPVVTNKTYGTPMLNLERETVLISDIDDDDALAQNMLRLMEDQNLYLKLKENGKLYVEEKYDNAKNAKLLAEQYRIVIDHYYNGIEIKEDSLLKVN